MTVERKNNWLKGLGYAVTLAVALISVGYGIEAAKDEIVANIVKVDTKVDKVDAKVDTQGARMDKMEEKVEKLSNKVDTIALRQHDNDLLNSRRYNFIRMPKKSHLVIEHVGTPGSVPTFIPFKPLASTDDVN